MSEDFSLTCYEGFRHAATRETRTSIVTTLLLVLEEVENGGCIWQIARTRKFNKKIATSALGTLFIATVFFYLGDRYAETLVTYPGQIFDHLGDAMLTMWETIGECAVCPRYDQ